MIFLSRFFRTSYRRFSVICVITFEQALAKEIFAVAAKKVEEHFFELKFKQLPDSGTFANGMTAYFGLSLTVC